MTLPSPREWSDLLLSSGSPETIWASTFATLGEIAQQSAGAAVDNALRTPDTLLAESAWELWETYPGAAPHTASALKSWWDDAPGTGRAVLIVDALSLRELKPLLAAAEERGAEPSALRVTGAELPTTTDAFARALGAASRSQLKGNRVTGAFVLAGAYTDLIDLPLEDALSRIPAERDVVLWMTEFDNLLHQKGHTFAVHHKHAAKTVSSDAFWAVLERLRQGRRLVVTADHGYAHSYAFHEEEDEANKAALQQAFGASRNASGADDWVHRSMPPLAVRSGDELAVLGQRKWKAKGGFAGLSHGGASLLEAAVPWVEFAPRS